MSKADNRGQVANQPVARSGCSDSFANETYHMAASPKIHSQKRRILGAF